MPQMGDTITFAGTHTSVSLTGEEVVELLLVPQHSADTLVYRTNATAAELEKRSADAIPFTVDLDFISNVGEALKGKTLFIKTPLWNDRSGRQVSGRKFVAVKVVEVLPANEVNPALVVFTDDAGAEHAVFMAPGGESKSTPRTFSSLFSFTDPRRGYPGIKDAIWNDIVHSRAAAGMTKTEAMLAMGAPTSIDRGHNHSATYERWSYPDGVYLIFEDGLLVRFNR